MRPPRPLLTPPPPPRDDERERFELRERVEAVAVEHGDFDLPTDLTLLVVGVEARVRLRLL